MLNLDIDFVEPTTAVLDSLFDLVVPGGIVLLDNYAGEGTSGKSLYGDTHAIDKFLRGKNYRIERFPFAARPSYIRK